MLLSNMSHNKKLLLGKILIIVVVLAIGGGVMSYGVYFFTTDSWMPPTSPYRPNIIIPGLGSFEFNVHNDMGLIPGNYLNGDIYADIAVSNDTKVQVTLPGGFIPGESNYTGGLAPAIQIPLNFISRGSLQTNSFHTKISGLVYYDPGDFNAILVTTKGSHTSQYTINDIMSIQPYSNYESIRNENISQAVLYFTAGLIVISISPVLVQLLQYISDFRKKSIWENWIKENNLNYKTKIRLRRKIIYFFLGFACGVADYVGLLIGSNYQQSTTVDQIIISITLALTSPLVYAASLIILIFSTSMPVFFKRIDPSSRPIYMGLAGLATSIAIMDLILATTNICNIPLYAHFGKCVNK